MNSFLQATANDLQVDSGFSSSEMISLGLKFRGIASSNLATEVLPTYSDDGRRQDVLLAAQPYAKQMIASFLAFGSPAATTTTSSARPRRPRRQRSRLQRSRPRRQTTPPSQVIFDNPKDLPEPWNPKPC